MKRINSFFIFLFLISTWPISLSALENNEDKISFSQKEFVKMGKRIYNTQGANTCVMCHGPGGKGGSIQEAPHLNTPREWDIFKALGGEKAFKENPQKLLKELETVHIALIQYGSLKWNIERDALHPDIKLDFSKTDDPDGKLNALMYGILQAPTLKEIEKIRKELRKKKKIKLSKKEMRHYAAKAVYQYVKTFDASGAQGEIFKNKDLVQKSPGQ